MKEQRQPRGRSKSRDQDRQGGGNRQRDSRRTGGGSQNYNGRGRSDYHSGNQRERISVESGFLVLIDQFMLANEQFTEQLSKLIDDDPAKKDVLVEDFGGRVVEIPRGLYRIDRNPYNLTIIIHPDGSDPSKVRSASLNSGSVFIDTRCLAMIDRELLDDPGLIEKYQGLWNSDQTKACRDLLRDNGGAVRYGFSKESDELSILLSEDKLALVLSPVGVEEGQGDHFEIEKEDQESQNEAPQT
jgi:hypothetical protein